MVDGERFAQLPSISNVQLRSMAQMCTPDHCSVGTLWPKMDNSKTRYGIYHYIASGNLQKHVCYKLKVGAVMRYV